MRRVLSIDGGGIKGAFPAAFVACIEDSLGHGIAGYFDLIVGTSTGGLIALALGLGVPAKKILNFYEDYARKIFAPKFLGLIRSVFSPKFDSKTLTSVLEGEFGSLRLGDSSQRLVIPSWSVESGELYVYKTAHSARFERDYKHLAIDVAMATCAAPFLYPAHTSSAGVELLDGALWANNPTGVAVVEAIGTLGWPAPDVNVLSLGCTTETLNLGGPDRSQGLAYWARNGVSAFLAAQSAASLGTAKVLLPRRDQVVRVSPEVASGRFRVDRAGDVPALKGLGYEEARKQLPLLREKFFQSQADEFLPFHRLEDAII